MKTSTILRRRQKKKTEQIIKVPRYDADRIVSKLIAKCRTRRGGGSFFDWRSLGVQAGICFNAAPSNVSFLNGPLLHGKEEFVAKKRTKRTRHKMSEEEANAEEEKPEDVQGHTERGADQLSAVEQNIADVDSALKNKVDKSYLANKKKIKRKHGSDEDKITELTKKLKRHTDVCAVNLLFNPNSFTQTVENIFHYSFMVKHGTAQIKVRGEKKKIDDDIKFDAGPVVKHAPNILKDNPGPARQAIVSLTMKHWRDLIEAYGVEKAGVPHREGSKYERLSNPSR